MHDFEVFIPEGYEVVETDRVVASDNAVVYTHFFASTAKRHAEQLNNARIGPTFRYVAERSPKNLTHKLGWMHRWCVVPYQNVIRKKVA